MSDDQPTTNEPKGPSVDPESPASPVVDRPAVDTDKADSKDAKRDISKDAITDR